MSVSRSQSAADQMCVQSAVDDSAETHDMRWNRRRATFTTLWLDQGNALVADTAVEFACSRPHPGGGAATKLTRWKLCAQLSAAAGAKLKLLR